MKSSVTNAGNAGKRRRNGHSELKRSGKKGRKEEKLRFHRNACRDFRGCREERHRRQQKRLPPPTQRPQFARDLHPLN